MLCYLFLSLIAASRHLRYFSSFKIFLSLPDLVLFCFVFLLIEGRILLWYLFGYCYLISHLQFPSCTVIGQMFIVENFNNLLSSPHKDDLQSGVWGTWFSSLWKRARTGFFQGGGWGKENKILFVFLQHGNSPEVNMVNSYVSLRRVIIRFMRTVINVSWVIIPHILLQATCRFKSVWLCCLCLLYCCHMSPFWKKIPKTKNRDNFPTELGEFPLLF